MLKHLRYTFPLQPRETRSCSTLVCVLLLDKFLWVKNVVDKSKMWLRGCARLFLRSYQRRFLESMKNSFQLFHQHHTIDMESKMSFVWLWWKSCKLWKVCGPVLRPDSANETSTMQLHWTFFNTYDFITWIGGTDPAIMLSRGGENEKYLQFLAELCLKVEYLNRHGGFFNWPPLKSSKYKKVNLG